MKIAIALLLLAAILVYAYSRSSRAARERFLENYSFPRGLDARLLKRRPELAPDQVKLVFDGLRQYFRIALMADKRMVAMPSQIVDDLWHEFILYTRNYQSFCSEAFGRQLHHTPAEAMAAPGTQGSALRRSWKLACKLEGIDPAKPYRLPLLFAIDSQLGISDGFHYVPDCKGVTTQSGGTYCGADLGSGSDGASDSGSPGDSDGGSGCGGGCGGD